MCRILSLLFLIKLSLLSSAALAEQLKIGKICPVTYQQEPIGMLIFSKAWYHSSRSDAKYTPGDNATGIGLEIHLKNRFSGQIEGLNIAACDRYRILQIRTTTARLHVGESKTQIDIPDGFDNPFYDNSPLEHGYGLHQTPIDDSDKPWQGRVDRDSAVAIYDTPYVSDSYGIEGEHIEVDFETCAVCERNDQYDTVLACGQWGYQRDYMGGMTGWTEPEFKGVQCAAKPSQTFIDTLIQSHRVDYSYWINWREASNTFTTGSEAN